MPKLASDNKISSSNLFLVDFKLRQFKALICDENIDTSIKFEFNNFITHQSLAHCKHCMSWTNYIFKFDQALNFDILSFTWISTSYNRHENINLHIIFFICWIILDGCPIIPISNNVIEKKTCPLTLDIIQF